MDQTTLTKLFAPARSWTMEQVVTALSGPFSLTTTGRPNRTVSPCPVCGASGVGAAPIVGESNEMGAGSWNCVQHPAGGNAVTLAALIVLGGGRQGPAQWDRVTAFCQSRELPFPHWKMQQDQRNIGFQVSNVAVAGRLRFFPDENQVGPCPICASPHVQLDDSDFIWGPCDGCGAVGNALALAALLGFASDGSQIGKDAGWLDPVREVLVTAFKNVRLP